MSYQQATVVGNVGSDPERRTVGEHTVVSFSVAVNEKRGEKELVTWFRVAAWNKLGDVCEKYVVKGMSVLVVGKIRANAYTDKSGNPAASLELSADTVRFLSKRDEPKVDMATVDELPW